MSGVAAEADLRLKVKVIRWLDARIGNLP